MDLKNINLSKIFTWTVVILLTGMFLMAGSGKLMSGQMYLDNFARWGLPLWFLAVTGIVEVAGALLILIPRLRFYGAVLLEGTMVGALLIHIVFAEYGALIMPLVLLTFASYLAVISRPQWLIRLYCHLPLLNRRQECSLAH